MIFSTDYPKYINMYKIHRNVKVVYLIDTYVVYWLTYHSSTVKSLGLSDQTKYYNIGICCFSAKQALSWRNKSLQGLARNQNDVSEWSDISTNRLLYDIAEKLFTWRQTTIPHSLTSLNVTTKFVLQFLPERDEDYWGWKITFYWFKFSKYQANANNYR